MISLYTLQRFAHFSPQDSTNSLIGRSRHSLSEAFTLYSGQAGTPTFPYISQSTTERGHTTYSTMPEPIMACGYTRNFLGMKYRMIPLSLGGIPQDDQEGPPGSPRTTLDSLGARKQSTQMCINVATLNFPLVIITLTTFINLTYQSPSTSMAKQYEHNVYSQGDQR